MDASDRDRWEFLREASEDLCAPASKLDFELNGNACAPAQALWSLRLRTLATRFRQLDSELERAQLMSAFFLFSNLDSTSVSYFLPFFSFRTLRLNHSLFSDTRIDVRTSGNQERLEGAAPACSRKLSESAPRWIGRSLGRC